MIRSSWLCAAVLFALAGPLPATAQPAVRHAVGLQAQDLGTALRLLAEQVQLQLVYPADLVHGKRAPAVEATLTAAEALDRLLEGSGLRYEFLDPQTVTLASLDSQAGTDTDRNQSAEGASTAPPHVERVESSPPIDSGTRDLATITVTGTRIRGGVAPSPVITIDSQRIREEGFADLGEVIRSVPQNFGGGQNPGVSSGGFSGAGFVNQNVTGGSSLNLRGLGPDATLTLLNGRRMAYSGFVQAIDIGAIPVEAVDRVEIVADGASAIYGSDAVGGVGNVILKRDFDGVAFGTRHGAATGGGLVTHEYSATAGTYWSGGGMIASFKEASVDPIYAPERGYSDHLPPTTTIHPGSALHSGLVSGYQTLGRGLELRLDLMRNRRDQVYSYDASGFNRLSPVTTNTMVAPGVEILLPGAWKLSLAATWAESVHDEYQARTAPGTGVAMLLVDDCYCNEGRTYELGGEGPLFALAGGDARLATGVGYRRNRFLQFSHLRNATLMQGEESAQFAYAEVNMPLVGPRPLRSRAQRLSFTAAVRGEDYSSFGSVATPKFGLVYGPSEDITAKASWGRSFKAPTLFQVNQGQFAQLDFPRNLGGSDYPDGKMILLSGGGNPELEPERARTWMASLAFHPRAVPGLDGELGLFRIDYSDRVVQPITDYSRVLADPSLAQFVALQPSVAELEQIMSTAQFFNFTGVPYDPGHVAAVVRGHHVNVARQKIRGVDLSASYRFELGAGGFSLRGSATWLESVQQDTASSEFADLSGTLFNPPRRSARAGGVWERAGFTASLFANHAGGVTNTADGRETASFTTFDVTLRYASGGGGHPWSGLGLTLSAQNLLDRAPPLYTPASHADRAPPYDSTNYSPVGRFVSLSISNDF